MFCTIVPVFFPMLDTGRAILRGAGRRTGKKRKKKFFCFLSSFFVHKKIWEISWLVMIETIFACSLRNCPCA